jgi:streptomycin 6-kinase
VTIMLVDELARTRLIRRFGQDVTTWIDGLPGLLASLSDRWGLVVDQHAPGGTSATFRCHRAGVLVFLKLTPEIDIAISEYRALSAWSEVPSMVSVLETDLTLGALLLEAVEPGDPVRDFFLPQLLTDLHVQADGFMPLRERVDFIFGLLRRRTTSASSGGDNVDRHHRLAAELARHDVPGTLLHGDLHQNNVLDGGERGAIAIDPRPCFGDPASDAVDMVYAGDDHDARIEALSGVVDGDRLRLWCDAYRPFFP